MKLMICLFIFIPMIAFSQNVKLDIFGLEIELDKPYTIKGPYRNGTVTFTYMPIAENESVSVFYIVEKKDNKGFCNLPYSTENRKIVYGIKNDNDVAGGFSKLIVCDGVNILIVQQDDIFAKKIINALGLKNVH